MSIFLEILHTCFECDYARQAVGVRNDTSIKQLRALAYSFMVKEKPECEHLTVFEIEYGSEE